LASRRAALSTEPQRRRTPIILQLLEAGAPCHRRKFIKIDFASTIQKLRIGEEIVEIGRHVLEPTYS
jgi:hypothetical protein